jgi:hypothetical protein
MTQAALHCSACFPIMPCHRFPPPWQVEQIPGDYKVLDALSRRLSGASIKRYNAWRDCTQGRFCMRTRIPKLIAEINTIIADHSNSDLAEEQEAIDLLKRARRALNLARVKLQEADLKSAPTARDNTQRS